MHPAIAVVVPMRNAADEIETLLTSLLSQDFGEPWELIVVDNGSDDDSGEKARLLLDPPLPINLVRVQVIEASPHGYATPRNAGVRASTAPLLAFCDADGAADKGWLKAIANSLRENRLVGSRKFRTDDVGNRNKDRVWFEQRDLFKILGVEFVATAGLGCTRELFEALDGFDPHFNNGGEDADFSLRARFQLGVVPIMERSAVYWSKVPRQRRKAFSKGYRNVRTEVRLYQQHHLQRLMRQDLRSPFGLQALVQSVDRFLYRLVRLRKVTIQYQIEFASEAGCLFARVVWSIEFGAWYLRTLLAKRGSVSSARPGA